MTRQFVTTCLNFEAFMVGLMSNQVHEECNLTSGLVLNLFFRELAYLDKEHRGRLAAAGAITRLAVAGCCNCSAPTTCGAGIHSLSLNKILILC